MRVLIVEDEWMIAIRIEQSLVAAGITVAGMVGSVDSALSAIDAGGLDAVVLDTYLGGESAEPVADLLASKNIPFLVVTGYASNQRPGRLATAPFLRKPFTSPNLLKLLYQMPLDGAARNVASKA